MTNDKGNQMPKRAPIGASRAPVQKGTPRVGMYAEGGKVKMDNHPRRRPSRGEHAVGAGLAHLFKKSNSGAKFARPPGAKSAVTAMMKKLGKMAGY